MNKQILLGVIGLVVLIVGVGIGYAIPKAGSLGGNRYDKQYMYDADIAGTATIKNLTLSGTATGLSTSSLATLSVSGASALHAITATTLAPTGIATMATTSATALCVWNGTNWVKITFSGVTPAYATSTTCL